MKDSWLIACRYCLHNMAQGQGNNYPGRNIPDYSIPSSSWVLHACMPIVIVRADIILELTTCQALFSLAFVYFSFNFYSSHRSISYKFIPKVLVLKTLCMQFKHFCTTINFLIPFSANCEVPSCYYFQFTHRETEARENRNLLQVTWAVSLRAGTMDLKSPFWPHDYLICFAPTWSLAFRYLRVN